MRVKLHEGQTDPIGIIADKLRERVLGSALPEGDALYRGISRRALAGYLEFFVPVVTVGTTMELGNGVYTTPDLKTACTYAGATGVILVFRKPELGDLNVVELGREEWEKELLGRWGSGEDEVDQRIVNADVLIGPISYNLGEVTRGRAPPKPALDCDNSPVSQWLFGSGRATELLARSLSAVVFLED